MLEKFLEDGYTEAIDLLNEDQIEQVLSACAAMPEKFLPWLKGRHSIVPEMVDLGSHPVLVDVVSKLLGDNLLLWSSQIIYQKPQVTHRWHIDVEHSTWDGVTVWLAMQNVTAGSIKLISRSQHLNITPQELGEKYYVDLTDDMQVLHEAQKRNPDCKLVNVKIKPGQFVIFDGRLWHGTHNATSNRRSSMIFQYTKPSNKLFIPLDNNYPGTRWSKLQPDCVLVKGRDDFRLNKIIDRDYSGSWKSKARVLMVHFPQKFLRKIIPA
ncbi:phytanoyl-CoA dioxygenase family protein [Litoribacter populi]|uniref:phytanoyl-CoA dioxygenase family protein n=1 Tax=Litoribacter populi TaxID=2598460 RepID=UPI00117FD3EB|nr:phytanoyl-CoA dioxygenase family protein [Litoribacter populi]